METSRILQTQNGFIIPITFFIAFILTLLPLPDWTVWLRPAWILMVLIYWIMMLPHRINMGTGWILGLCLDVLNGTLLGEHALAMTFAAYVVAKMHARLKMFPLLQQGLCVMLLVLLYQFILFCIQGFLGQLPSNWLFWSSPVTSMLLWPWVFNIIKACQRHYRIA